MPVNYAKYPPDWFDVIRPAVLAKDGYKCADCKAGQRQLFTWVNGERMLIVGDFEREYYITRGHKISTIWLSISHQDHNTENNHISNLFARCQRCHLRHDKEWHRATRLARKKGKKR